MRNTVYLCPGPESETTQSHL